MRYIVILFINFLGVHVFANLHGVFKKENLNSCDFIDLNIENKKQKVIKSFEECPTGIIWNTKDNRLYYSKDNKIIFEESSGKVIFKVDIPMPKYADKIIDFKLWWNDNLKTINIAVQAEIPESLLKMAKNQTEDSSKQLLVYNNKEYELIGIGSQTFVHIYELVKFKKEYSFKEIEIKPSSTGWDMANGINIIFISKSQEWYPNNVLTMDLNSYRDSDWPTLYSKNSKKIEKLIGVRKEIHGVWFYELEPGKAVVLGNCSQEGVASMCGPMFYCEKYCSNTKKLIDKEKSPNATFRIVGASEGYLA